MGLPQLDFRVPEATWFKSVLSGKFGMPGLSATGTLALPYKIAVVAVMALVACGTLVTFGSAGANERSSAETSALPGSDEASPTVEGQVLPPTSPALLNSADLLSTLNLTDYSPDDSATTALSLSDDDDDDDDDKKTSAAIKKRLNSTKPTAKPTAKPTTGTKSPAPTPTKTTTPAPTPTKTTTPVPIPTKTTAPPPEPEPTPTPSPVCKPLQRLAGKC